MQKKENQMRLPSVDVLLRDGSFAKLLERFGHGAVRDAIREVLENKRRHPGASTESSAILNDTELALDKLTTSSLKPVFNMTGTILHTNLGRAPLPDCAVQAMVEAAGAVNLEYDLGTGNRGQRDGHVANWICKLTGAEAAIVVNNNAAAVMIALNTLALGQKVLVSRGELIEIGGAFRMPDIMKRAGCILHEVGTTNRTHERDFSTAIHSDTAMILKVHASNYQVQGFTKAVPEPVLAKIAKSSDIPFVVDLGSGTLVDLEQFGLPHETTVRETLNNGADLVTFSGDKLLGGPQAGIIAGRADLVAKIAANPMKRAMRLDKITLAALGAVLRLYFNSEKLAAEVPVLALLARGELDIRNQAERLQPIVAARLDGLAAVEIVPCQSQIGSGALPVDLLDSFALRLTPCTTTDQALRDLAFKLRQLPCPIIGRISNGAVLLDVRALTNETKFLAQFQEIAL